MAFIKIYLISIYTLIIKNYFFCSKKFILMINFFKILYTYKFKRILNCLKTQPCNRKMFLVQK